MKTSNPKTTYALVIQSEEKGRTLFETAIYALFSISAAFSIWQFAAQATVVPNMHANVLSAQASANPACDAQS